MTYADFVALKAAPPSALTDQEFHLLHGALGLATEILEVSIADPDDTENIIEELGDLCFYLQLVESNCGETVPTEPTIDIDGFGAAINTLEGQIEALISLIKKRCIYGHMVTLGQHIANIWYLIGLEAADVDTTMTGVLLYNQEKLNKRYKSAFSQEEAEERRDKENGQ